MVAWSNVLCLNSCVFSSSAKLVGRWFFWLCKVSEGAIFVSFSSCLWKDSKGYMYPQYGTTEFIFCKFQCHEFCVNASVMSVLYYIDIVLCTNWWCQVLVVRQDLKMGPGKIASQCARKIYSPDSCIICTSILQLLPSFSDEIVWLLADAATGMYSELMQR